MNIINPTHELNSTTWWCGLDSDLDKYMKSGSESCILNWDTTFPIKESHSIMSCAMKIAESRHNLILDRNRPLLNIFVNHDLNYIFNAFLSQSHPPWHSSLCTILTSLPYPFTQSPSFLPFLSLDLSASCKLRWVLEMNKNPCRIHNQNKIFQSSGTILHWFRSFW